ncbi:MAG: helix-turn-helix domain-containing protein [Terriglobia bacterium]
MEPTSLPGRPQPGSRLDGAAHGIEKLLTSKEASEVLKIHPKVLERMAKRGEVPALKVGKFWRYRASMLDAWINSRLQSGRQPCRMETSF